MGWGCGTIWVDRAFKFRKALAAQDKASGGNGQISCMFIGDLNSMGLDYPFDRKITSELELMKWDQTASRSRGNPMRRLPKIHELSWSNGTGSTIPDSNLDHVFATRNLTFKSFARPDGADAEVKVTGWVDFEDDPPKKDEWISEFSDHSLLYLELES